MAGISRSNPEWGAGFQSLRGREVIQGLGKLMMGLLLCLQNQLPVVIT